MLMVRLAIAFGVEVNVGCVVDFGDYYGGGVVGSTPSSSSM